MQTTNKTGYKAIIVTTGILLVVCIFSLGWAIGHYQESPGMFKKGQILLPDMVHPNDTLIVYDPEYLNECLSDGRLKTDGDIMEILNETCVRNIVDPHEYQIDITEDSTYIYMMGAGM